MKGRIETGRTAPTMGADAGSEPDAHPFLLQLLAWPALQQLQAFPPASAIRIEVLQAITMESVFHAVVDSAAVPYPARFKRMLKQVRRDAARLGDELAAAGEHDLARHLSDLDEPTRDVVRAFARLPVTTARAQLVEWITERWEAVEAELRGHYPDEADCWCIECLERLDVASAEAGRNTCDAPLIRLAIVGGEPEADVLEAIQATWVATGELVDPRGFPIVAAFLPE